jgi:hypothetical protein
LFYKTGYLLSVYRFLINIEVESGFLFIFVECCKIVYQRREAIQAAEEKKDDRSRLAAIIREVDRFLSDGLVKVFHPIFKRNSATQSTSQVKDRRGIILQTCRRT